jgi:hypothetical protein
VVTGDHRMTGKIVATPTVAGGLWVAVGVATIA